MTALPSECQSDFATNRFSIPPLFLWYVWFHLQTDNAFVNQYQISNCFHVCATGLLLIGLIWFSQCCHNDLKGHQNLRISQCLPAGQKICNVNELPEATKRGSPIWQTSWSGCTTSVESGSSEACKLPKFDWAIRSKTRDCTSNDDQIWICSLPHDRQEEHRIELQHWHCTCCQGTTEDAEQITSLAMKMKNCEWSRLPAVCIFTCAVIKLPKLAMESPVAI